MDKCNHEWIYEDKLLLSNPPQQRIICSECGEKKTISLGKLSDVNTYQDTVNKFSTKCSYTNLEANK